MREDERGKRSRNGGSLYSVCAQNWGGKKRQKVNRYTEGRGTESEEKAEWEDRTRIENDQQRPTEKTRQETIAEKSSLRQTQCKKKIYRFDQGQNKMLPFFLSLPLPWINVRNKAPNISFWTLPLSLFLLLLPSGRYKRLIRCLFLLCRVNISENNILVEGTLGPRKFHPALADSS